MLNLEQRYQDIVMDVLNSHVPDMEVWVFGSRITSRYKPHSDLDLVLITRQPLDNRIMFALKDDLQESELPVRVDVLDWQQISESFRQLILQHYEIFRSPDSSAGTE